MPRFHMHTLGCKVNRAESDAIAAALLDAGWEQGAPDEADVSVVNTCTVTGEADHKNRKVIRNLLRAGSAHVIVTGCAANLESGRYADISPRIVCVTDKAAVPRVARELLDSPETALSRAAGQQGAASPRAAGARFAPRTPGSRTRVDLKIQDGCDNACTFCIVHTARGKARSTPAEEVVATVRRAAQAGTREVVLVGIDLAAYRSDGLDLAALVFLLQGETGIGRIRLSSVEPQSMTPSLVSALASSDGRLCRHLHLCLQSGSSKVLREMARHYDADGFAALVADLHAQVPRIALSTDVIVGFPGETDADFHDTCALVERCGFMRLHVFRYSRRPGTPAAARSDQVDPKVKAQRAAKLRDLGEKLALRDMAARIDTTEQVVVERPGIGTSESYHKVLLDRALPPGALVPLTLADVDERQRAFVGR